MKKARKPKRIRIPILLLILVLLLAGGCIWYIRDFYRCEPSAAALLAGTDQVAISSCPNGLFLDGPGEDSALIFYPGAKVEYTAYLPLLCRVAEGGTDCFALRMPGNLAILGQNRAAAILDGYDYNRWYLGGHSLGGAMAAGWAAGHIGELDGLVLLAAYPTKELSGSDFAVLSVYGSEDGVLNMEKLESGRELMPADYTELCIQGGCHAWFGNYGAQKGDGTPSITQEEQQAQTAEAILALTGAA